MEVLKELGYVRNDSDENKVIDLYEKLQYQGSVGIQNLGRFLQTVHGVVEREDETPRIMERAQVMGYIDDQGKYKVPDLKTQDDIMKMYFFLH